MPSYSSYKPTSGVSKLLPGTGTSVSTTTGVVTLWVSGDLFNLSGTSSTFVISNTATSTSTDTGALVVYGGVGIGGSLNVGQESYINGAIILTSATIAQYGGSQTVIYAGTDTVVNTNTGIISIWNNSTLQTVTDRGFTTTNRIEILNTASNAIDVAGGIRLVGALNVDNTGTVSSIQSQGGATLAKDLVLGGTFTRQGNIIKDSWFDVSGAAVTVASADYRDLTSTGDITGTNASIWIGSPTFSSENAVTYSDAATVYIENAPSEGANTTLTNRYALLVNNGIVKIKSNAQSASPTTGALVIEGGIGIGGNAYIDGDLVVNGSQIITTATIGMAGVIKIIPGTGIQVNPSEGTGTVLVTSIATLQNVTDEGSSTDNVIQITNATQSINTNSSQALLVSGGIGANLVSASQLFDNARRVITDVIPSAGNGISIGSLNSSGTTASFVIENIGVTSITGTDGQITVSTSTGSVIIGLASGINFTTGTFDNLVINSTVDSISTATGSIITRGGIGVAKSIVVGSTATIVGTTNAVSTNTGALQVQGGAAIARDLYAGSNVTVKGSLLRSGNITSADWLDNGIAFVSSGGIFTATSLGGIQGLVAVNAFGIPTISSTNSPTYSDAATIYIAGSPVAGTGAAITNAWALYSKGDVKIASPSESVSSSTGALVVTGGVGIGGNLKVSGNGSFAASGISVGSSLISSFVRGPYSVSGTFTLDTFTTSTFRTAKYLVQVDDGEKIHISEITLFHDNINVYKNEYGISTNLGELGNFDAALVAGSVSLSFTPNYLPYSMNIRGTRTTIAI